MREHKELAREVDFLNALAALLRNDGQLQATDGQALEEAYATILAAVAQAGLEPDKTELEEEPISEE